MSEVKRRKVPGGDNTEVRGRPKSSNFAVKTNKLRLYFLTTLVFTICLLGVYLHFFQGIRSSSHKVGILDSLFVMLGVSKYVNAIVIDAGSTGSRILCYTFLSSSGGNYLKLQKEFFREVKPGISSFANNPAESVKNLELLLNDAKRIIPSEEWAETSLVMKATAGLRLLPEQKAKALLREARNLFKKSGFKVADDAVSIVDGTEEGLMSWFTVNFLLGRLGPDTDPSKTVAALDLGGGSTQVAFVPSKSDSLTQTDRQYLTRIKVFNKHLEVYSRSFLGLGLNEGRKRILQFNTNSTDIISECINPLVKTQWSYGGVTYSITGPNSKLLQQRDSQDFVTPVVDFVACERIIQNVLSEFGVPPSLKGKEMYAFSYYYDKAAESGLIDYKTGQVIKLEELSRTAKGKCSEANVDQPFMCLDLIFISALLRDTFNIPEKSEINLYKWINGHEVSWALGAAFLNLQSQIL